MKHIAYFYNLTFYFFYRGAINFVVGLNKINPLLILTRLYYEVPSVKQKFLDKGIENPYSWHIKKAMKDRLVNKKFSFAIIVGGGITIITVWFLLIGILHIVTNLFFPLVDYNFKSYWLGLLILAYLTNYIFSEKNDQGEEYIKEFNKRKGFWRINWSILTATLPFFAIWFSISTSDKGVIGQYLLSLSADSTYSKPVTNQEIKDAIEKSKNNPNSVWYDQNNKENEETKSKSKSKVDR